MAEISTLNVSPSMQSLKLRVVVSRAFQFRVWFGSRLVLLAARIMGASGRIEIE